MWWLTIPLVGGVWDVFTGDIPDWITVPIITVGAVWSVLKSPVSLLLMLLFGLTGYVLYRFGVVGGGDILLVLAVTPFIHNTLPLAPFLLFFLSLALSTAFYGVFFSILQGKFLRVIPVPFLPPVIALLYGILLMGLVDRGYFVREKGIDELEEEDVLAEPVEGFPKMVVEKGDVERLKRLGVKSVKVLVNLPRMGPFIFLAGLLLELYTSNPSLILPLLARGLFPLS